MQLPKVKNLNFTSIKCYPIQLISFKFFSLERRVDREGKILWMFKWFSNAPKGNELSIIEWICHILAHMLFLSKLRMVVFPLLFWMFIGIHSNSTHPKWTWNRNAMVWVLILILLLSSWVWAGLSSFWPLIFSITTISFPLLFSYADTTRVLSIYVKLCLSILDSI